jgi:carbon monoxide dehydrogenase subunit G
VGAFEVVREVPMEPAEVFARLTDWERHGEAVPLTRIRRTESGFVARTGVGPLGFDDVMDVVAWDPPRSCRIEKRGRVVKGWAEVHVEPTPHGSRVVWREVAHTVGVPRFAARLEEAAGRRLFGRVVDHLLRT